MGSALKPPHGTGSPGDAKEPVALPRKPRTAISLALAISLAMHLLLLAAFGYADLFHFRERNEVVFNVELFSTLDPALKPFLEESKTPQRAGPAPKKTAAPPPARHAPGETVLIRRPPAHPPVPAVPPPVTPEPSPEEEEPKEEPATPEAPMTESPGESSTPEPEESKKPTAAATTAATPAAPTTVTPQQTPAPSPTDASPAAGTLAVALAYRNDERIPRNARGLIVLDPEELAEMDNVKPILVAVPPLEIDPERAAQLGIAPGDRISAAVTVTIVLDQKGYGAPVLVPPASLEIGDLKKESPPPLAEEHRKKIEELLKEKLMQTRWFPATDRGVPRETSSETFAIEISAGGRTDEKAPPEQPATAP